PLMKVGDKWRLYVPSELAYGADGFGPVPPNAVLIFDLELLEVAPATAAPANPAAPATLPRPTK
ncbi:MAG: FKBP-type peptidyl-prolyl cis-trans isomerase, partial [Planctomycetota bacterium]